MRVLLDTHAFLWFILNDKQLGIGAMSVMRDTSNIIYLSPASYWEIAIKISSGKFQLTIPYEQF